MSLSSMTGYGRASAEQTGRRVTVEISSVNRKQLDVQTQLPRAYAGLEPKVQEFIRGHLQRGRVHVGVTLQQTEGAQGSITVDQARAEKSVEALRQAGGALGLHDDLGLSHLLVLPEVVKPVQPEDDPDAVWSLIETALKSALRDVKAMRDKEGAQLQKQLEGVVKKIVQHTQKIQALAPQASREYEKRLLNRLKQSGLKEALDDDRVLKEVALFAEKVDVTEEVHRLNSHVVQVEACFKQRKPAGRTLDFLAQEMLREMNTIGSKCNNVNMTKRVIQSKAELDRFKEQVQNIE